MFLHIDGVYYIPIESIICIFDINSSGKPAAQRFMESAEKENRVIYACGKDQARSAVAAKKGDKIYIYISSAAAVSLGRRRHKGLKTVYERK